MITKFYKVKNKWRVSPIRCDYCGKFISYADLQSGAAYHEMSVPDSPFGPEEYDSYHVSCQSKFKIEVAERQKEWEVANAR